jgi:hypothetical protein
MLHDQHSANDHGLACSLSPVTWPGTGDVPELAAGLAERSSPICSRDVEGQRLRHNFCAKNPSNPADSRQAVARRQADYFVAVG